LEGRRVHRAAEAGTDDPDAQHDSSFILRLATVCSNSVERALELPFVFDGQRRRDRDRRPGRTGLQQDQPARSPPHDRRRIGEGRPTLELHRPQETDARARRGRCVSIV
jgi:hypothetical protein